MVAWKNWQRLSESSWSKPRDGMVKPGSREVSRKALLGLQGAAGIAAIIVAAMAGAFSSGFGLLTGLFWLIFAALIANSLVRVQPATGSSRGGGGLWAGSGDTSSGDGGSSDSGSGTGDSSSGDPGDGGDSGGGGSSA